MNIGENPEKVEPKFWIMFALILTLLPTHTDDFSYALASFYTFSHERKEIEIDFHINQKYIAHSSDGDEDIEQNRIFGRY